MVTADTEIIANDPGTFRLSKIFEGLKYRSRYLIVALLLIIALRLGVSVLSGAGQNWDFVNFYNTGARAFHGEEANIYRSETPIAGRSVGVIPSGFTYGGSPLSAYVFAPLGALPPRLALLVFKAACAVFFALALLALYGHFRDLVGANLHPDSAVLVYLFLVLFFEPFWFVFTIGGQSTPLAFLFLALFLRSYLGDRIWPAAILFAMAALIKPFLVLPVAIFMIAGDWRFLKRLALCFLFCGAFSWLLLGLDLHVEWLYAVRKDASWWGVPWSKNSSILGFFGNFWLYVGGYPIRSSVVPAALLGLQITFKVLLIALFAWMVTKVRKSDLPIRAKRHHFILLAILFALFFSNVVWAHYLAFLFIPILFLVAKYQLLSKGAKILTVLILLATVRANWPLTLHLDRSLTVNTFAETLAVSLLGSGALLLTLILLLLYNRDLLYAHINPQSG